MCTNTFLLHHRMKVQNHKYFLNSGYRLLAHIFRGQVASLMLCDRTKKKMTFVGLESTHPAIRAVVFTN